MLKKKVNKRGMFVVLTVSFLILCIVGIYIIVKPCVINYGISEYYTQKEMDEAIKLIKDEFYSWEGCKLYSIDYTSDELCKKELEYCNTLAADEILYDECIIFRTEFRSPIFGGGAWNANYHYDWKWYLARTNNGSWELLTWGMP